MLGKLSFTCNVYACGCGCVCMCVRVHVRVRVCVLVECVCIIHRSCTIACSICACDLLSVMSL